LKRERERSVEEGASTSRRGRSLLPTSGKRRVKMKKMSKKRRGKERTCILS